MAGKTLTERVASLETLIMERARTQDKDIEEMKKDVKEIKTIVSKFGENCLKHRAKYDADLRTLKEGIEIKKSAWDVLTRIAVAAMSSLALILSAALAAGWRPF